MGNLRLILQFQKDQSCWAQIGIGVLLSLIGITFVEVFRHWLSNAPYPALVLAVVASYVLGGGALSGTITTFALLAYTLKFVATSGWFPYSIFFATGVLVAYLVKTTKDRIRTLRDAEIRAEESERLKLAASAGKLGIWEWDIANDHMVWDDQMLEFYGLTKESFMGSISSWKNCLHPEDKIHSSEILEKALKAKPYFNSEFQIVRPNGEIRSIQSQSLVIRDGLGKPLKMFGLNRDVTEEKKNLQKIQELNAYLETALEQSQAGIVIVDAPNGDIKFANQAALAIADRAKEEVVDNIDASKYESWGVAGLNGRPLEGKEFPIVKAMSEGKFIKEELLILRPSGEKRIVLANAAPIRRQDGSIIAGIVIFLDITEKHLLLEKIKAAQKQAEEAMMAKARFLDVAAHELRTPVTAISLMVQLAQRESKKGTVVASAVLDRLRVQADRLSRLVVDLLEVSKLDRGVLELRYEWADFGELIKECISYFKLQFPDKPIVFSMPEEPVRLNLDADRIYEVIANLIDNAIKYSVDDSPLEIHLESNTEHAYFSISDHGPGLSEHIQKRLFGAFERENHDLQKRYSGLGLGLFISRGIIELHGGSIGVRSQKGQGSTFFFNLPRTLNLAKTGTEDS